jgi:diguanylate cyclase (GGDEF)-like protein
VAIVTICATLITMTSGLLFVPNDEFRMVWFLIAVIVAHLVVGRGFGLTIVALSIFIVVGANYIFDINFSGLTLTTFVVSILITSLLLLSWSDKIDGYQRLLLSQNSALKNLANRDDLTGIMSRRYFLDMANHYFNGAQRNKSPLSLLMLDIDHFKRINDRYGHPVGDQMLLLFTDTISIYLRKSDIFGRLGGEEFGIILFETGKEGAAILAEKIRRAVEEISYKRLDVEIKMTTSIGIGERIDQETDFDKLMIRADKALYDAKEAGRNRIAQAS